MNSYSYSYSYFYRYPLIVPSLSSYAWTASAVAGSSKPAIYILVHNDDLVGKDLTAVETSDSEDFPEVTFAKNKGITSINYYYCK